MQSSIWHWAILLLLFGVPVFFAVRSAAKPSTDSALVGFGGWLLLLAIFLGLSLLRGAAELASSGEAYSQLITLPNGPLATYGEIALSLALMALQAFVFVSMLRRSHRFKRLFLYQWLAMPVVFVADTVWISAVLGFPVGQVLSTESLATAIIAFALTGLWVAYVYKSVRVSNTFTRADASGYAEGATS
ncbi:DUF2569 family protein [Mesorhizobium sp. INR15]|uniref:DUF2569 family protein n=1 Tax=Mesorhizobium sp. INR15 TaxID=2654248 RepID=UPI00189675EF|nr:DUF2569 family protein [Mesorhizobium sp. INR15]QPC93284.1 DUF2569 family protein [Mesorhizobium sp. INR15]